MGRADERSNGKDKDCKMKHNQEQRQAGALERRLADVSEYEAMLRSLRDAFVVDGKQLNREKVLLKLEKAERDVKALQEKLATSEFVTGQRI